MGIVEHASGDVGSPGPTPHTWLTHQFDMMSTGTSRCKWLKMLMLPFICVLQLNNWQCVGLRATQCASVVMYFLAFAHVC